jgi:hypothetical protein
MLDPKKAAGGKNVPAWVRMNTTPKATMAAFRATERFL